MFNISKSNEVKLLLIYTRNKMVKKSCCSSRKSSTWSIQTAKDSDRELQSIWQQKMPKNTSPFRLGRARYSASYSQDSKIKFELDIVIRFLIRTYKLNVGVYLYCLKILDRLNFNEESIKDATLCRVEISVAIFQFAARVFGKEHLLSRQPLADIFRDFNISLKQDMLQRIKGLACGININLIFKPSETRRQLLLKRKQMKRQALNFVQMENSQKCDQETDDSESSEMDEE